MKNFVAGIITGALLAAFIAIANAGEPKKEETKEIEAVFGHVNLVVDGRNVDKETLYYDGTTYVPLMAIAEALGTEIKYYEDTNTAYINTNSGGASATDATPVEKKQETKDVTVKNETVVSETAGQKNAVEKAKDYLGFMPFSRGGLIAQLEFEKFSNADATYGADNCGADWYEQAAKKAQDYLDIMSFSRDGLIDQLEFEQFTREQAVYGVEAVGLD